MPQLNSCFQIPVSLFLTEKKITGQFTFKIHRKSYTSLFFKNNWKCLKLWLYSHNISLLILKHIFVSSSFSRDPLLVTGSSKHIVTGAYEVQIHHLVWQNKVLHLSTRSIIRTVSNKRALNPSPAMSPSTVWMIHNQISNSKFNHRLMCHFCLTATFFPCQESLFLDHKLSSSSGYLLTQ